MVGAAVSIGSQPAQRSFQGIQILRAVAVLLVVGNHALALAPEGIGAQVVDPAWAAKGAVGVDLFFVISGFIIAYVSLRSPNLTPKLTFAEFAIKRFVRIIPFLWFSVLLYNLVRLVLLGSFDPEPALRAFFVWPVGEMRPNVVWTLRHELLFYTLFALSFLFTRRLAWIVYLWTLTPLVVGPWLVMTGSSLTSNSLLALLVSPQNFCFAVGLTIGLCYLRYGTFSKISIKPWVSAIVLSVATLGVLLLRDTVSLPVVAIACGLLLIGGLVTQRSESLVARMFEFLGNASYAIYLTHNLGLLIALALWDRFFGAALPEVAVVAASVLAIACSCVIHLYIEKPLIRMVNRRVPRRDRVPPTPSEGIGPER